MPTFWPFFGAPSMLATARGAKRHLGELHVSGSKGGILRPSRLRSRIPYGFRRLRRGLKTKYSLAFESPSLLCQTIPIRRAEGSRTKCWAEGFFHGKNWIYTSNTFDLLWNIHFLVLESPAWAKNRCEGVLEVIAGQKCWAEWDCFSDLLKKIK